MAKKGKTTSAPAPTFPPFPHVSNKPVEDLAITTVLQDQILTLDGILTASECELFVTFVESLPLEMTPPKKRGEADRYNFRISAISPEFAKRLQDVITPHLPSFPWPASSGRAQTTERRSPRSFNSNIRMYKYVPGQLFGPHYDDSVRDSATGHKSEWTLLIYLSGVQDGVKGGETLFYNEQRGRPKEVITAPLTRGTALFHRHGQECMLHEGSPVLEGTKYILRSDLMF